MYPGNRSSIRFERLRDGIEQYEKINLLRSRAGESPAAAAAVQKMNERLAALFSVERSKGHEHTQDVEHARRIVDEALAVINAE